MDVYAENILDHYRSPRNKTLIAGADVEHKEINTSCGDEISVSLSVGDGSLVGIGWEGTGCAISQAAISLLSEELIGKSLEDIEKLSPQYVYDLLGVPIGTRRTKCALLSLHALKNTLRKFHGNSPQSWNDTIAENGAAFGN